MATQTYFPQQPETTPPATVTQQPHFIGRVLDILSRPLYGLSSAALGALRGEPLWESFVQGWTGERPTSFRDVALELGVPETPIIPAFEGIPVLGSTWAGAAGFLGDVFLDPLNLVGVGTINRAGRLAQRAGQLKGLRSAQALEGQRDLITLGGVGLSSLPGRAGELARQGQAAVYRGFERAGESLASTRLGQNVIDVMTTRGTGPVRVVRERLRQRESEEAFQLRQASRRYGQQRRRIIEIANQYGLDPEELNQRIVQAAETPPRMNDPIFNSLPPEAQEVVQQIRASQPERLGRELAAGVQTPEFQSERINYLHRVASEEFRAARRNREFSEWLQQNRPILSVRHGAQKPRTIAPDAYIREINQAAVEGRTKLVWIDSEGNIVPEGTKGATRQYVITDKPQKSPALPRVPIFSEDPSVIELARERMSIRTVTTAQALDDITRFGIDEGWAVRATSKEHAEELLSQGWRSIQAPRFGEKLKDIYFPEAVAKEIDKFMRLFTTRDKNVLADAIRGALRWWRDQTLFVFPEYHIRNLGTGLVKNYYADLHPTNAKAYGLGQVFAIYRQADRMAPRSGLADRISQALGEFGQSTIKTKDGKSYTLRQVLDWYEAERLGQGYFEGQFQVGDAFSASDVLRGRGFEFRRLNPLSRDSYMMGMGKAIGTYIEDNLRGSLFIHKLMEGLSPHDAANVVRQYHFDYSDIPEWMKVSRDYATPFITWAYKNIPNEIATLIQNPGKISRIVHTARAAEAGAEGPRPEQHEVPNFLLLPIYLGRDEKGNARFGNILSMWGMLDVAEFFDGSMGALRYIANQLHAFWQELLIEQPFNLDLYFMEPINPPELEQVGRQAPSGPWGIPARVEHALQLYRPYTLARRFVDPSTTPSEDILRSLTSLTTYESNPYYSGPYYYRNAQEAAQYYLSQVGRYDRLAQEAMQRGDTRAALRYQRMADEWRNQARRAIPEMLESLPRPRQ